MVTVSIEFWFIIAFNRCVKSNLPRQLDEAIHKYFPRKSRFYSVVNSHLILFGFSNMKLLQFIGLHNTKILNYKLAVEDSCNDSPFINHSSTTFLECVNVHDSNFNRVRFLFQNCNVMNSVHNYNVLQMIVVSIIMGDLPVCPKYF